MKVDESANRERSTQRYQPRRGLTVCAVIVIDSRDKLRYRFVARDISRAILLVVMEPVVSVLVQLDAFFIVVIFAVSED